MTDLVYDYITTGVDMMVTAAILAAVVLLLKSTSMLSSYSAQQQANSDRVQYYREYSMYDATSGLTASDALSALKFYGNSIEVYVWLDSTSTSYGGTCLKADGKGKYYYKTPSSGWTEVAGANLVSYIPPTASFKCKIGEDFKDKVFTNNGTYAGGIISQIIFYK